MTNIRKARLLHVIATVTEVNAYCYLMCYRLLKKKRSKENDRTRRDAEMFKIISK